ncbi:MAG: insulinase family protein [Microscillaceae bacterium]|nr:insulinase family protein [Microscillaceae bacterium]
MLDRKTPPLFHPIDNIQILPLTTQMLPNGVSLHILNAGTQPLLRLEIIFSAGTSYESQANVSYFTVKMLGEGTQKRSSSEIMEYIDQYGAFIDFNHGVERVSVSIYTLNKYLANLLPILVELISEPTFPDKEFQNLKNITIQSLQVNEEKNNYLASKLFRELLFGPNHPYGKNLQATYIQPLEREDLVNHFQKNIQNRKFELIMVGSFSPRELDLVSRTFESLTIDNQVNSPISLPMQATLASRHFFQKEGSLQSSIRIGCRLFGKSHPDYFALAVTNEIFGGYFGSRLMKNIREEKGYTYGIHSSLVLYKEDGYWVVGTDVKKDFTEQTLAEIAKEAQKMQTEPVDAQELAIVKNYMLGAFAGSLNTPFDLAEVFKGIYFNQLTYEFYQKYIEQIQNITAEDILATAQKYLKIENMLEVVVGAK